MTYWAFDEFAADLERCAFELEDASELARGLLPLTVGEALWFEFYMAHYYLRVAAWEFRMITEWAKGISTPTGQPLSWPEIYGQIEATYFLQGTLAYLSFQTMTHGLDIDDLQRAVGQIALLERPDLSAELAALTEHVKILHKTVGVLLLGEEVEKVAEGKPWTFWLKPWNWLGGITEGLGEFLGSLAALPAEVLISAGTRILVAVWGEEYQE